MTGAITDKRGHWTSNTGRQRRDVAARGAGNVRDSIRGHDAGGVQDLAGRDQLVDICRDIGTCRGRGGVAGHAGLRQGHWTDCS